MTVAPWKGKGLTQLTGMNRGYSISSLDDLFNEIEKPEPVMVTEPFDALARSCLNYVANHHGGNNRVYAGEITEYDLNKAKEIREYYSKKLMVLTLRGKKLTKFRQDLQSYIANGYTNAYPEKYCGLIYRLPEFYEYDQQLDELRVESNNTPQDSFIGVKSLTLVKKMQRDILKGKFVDYWFHDADKRVYKFTSRKENELLPFFDSMLKSGTIRVSCHFVKNITDDLHFCKMRNVRLVD